jgi:hypothetical protein
MPTNQLLLMSFLRPHGIFAMRKHQVQLFLKAVERIIPFGRGQAVTAKDSPMPGCVAPGSISVLTSDQNKWKPVGNECYTSDLNLPLYLIHFGGFDEGDCLIFTDISWRVTVRSNVSGRNARFFVCSVPPSGSECGVANDKEPTPKATICAPWTMRDLIRAAWTAPPVTSIRGSSSTKLEISGASRMFHSMWAIHSRRRSLPRLRRIARLGSAYLNFGS